MSETFNEIFGQYTDPVACGALIALVCLWFFCLIGLVIDSVRPMPRSSRDEFLRSWQIDNPAWVLEYFGPSSTKTLTIARDAINEILATRGVQ